MFLYDYSRGYTAIGTLTGGSPEDGPMYDSDTYTLATTITSDMLSLFLEYRS